MKILLMIITGLFISTFLIGSHCDNYHTQGRQRIVCNGHEVNRQCQGTRWKISYLGTDGINITEDKETVHITGLMQTEHKEKSTETGICYPNGYNIILHYDRIYKSIPEKVAVATVFVLMTIGATAAIFPRLEGLFRKEEKKPRKYL